MQTSHELLHEQHFRKVENLVYEWARCIDENRVEDISALLMPEGRYTVISRFNHDRGLPLAIMDCRSADQLRDRIMSMRIANVYEPQHYRHIVSGVQIVAATQGTLHVRSNYLVVRTMDLTGDMKIISVGQCVDVVDLASLDAGEPPKFQQRQFIFDSRVIETLLIIPL
jgi:anthranilate 1,2-dioxygenase small subunit